VERMLEDVDVGELDGASLHGFVDELQQGIAGVHDFVAASYFRATPAGSAVLAFR
jgi:hypothetical protein